MLEQLKTVLCDVNGQTLTDNCILAASPLHRQPDTNPYRIVLRLWNGQFVIHMQFWLATTDEPLSPDMDNSGFTKGDYFPLHRFAEAMEKWCERCQKQVKFAPSIYRNIHAA